MATRSRKRSTWASGSGKVPSSSIGFWVASTMKGRSSGRVTPSAVTWRSCMASSRADWVRGVARLISSASTTWLMIGPGRNSNSWALLVEPAQAGHIGGQQVRGELDAAEGAAQRSCQRARQGGFAGAGHIFQQNMSLAQHGRQQQLDHFIFADDDFLDISRMRCATGWIIRFPPQNISSFVVYFVAEFADHTKNKNLIFNIIPQTNGRLPGRENSFSSQVS